MNEDIIKGHWHEMKGKLKTQWGKLTDDDVTTMQGSFEELQGHLQKTYGYNEDKAKEEIDAFVRKNGWDK